MRKKKTSTQARDEEKEKKEKIQEKEKCVMKKILKASCQRRKDSKQMVTIIWKSKLRWVNKELWCGENLVVAMPLILKI